MEQFQNRYIFGNMKRGNIIVIKTIGIGILYTFFHFLFREIRK